jgi:octaprenyl-diphosphate synthase
VVDTAGISGKDSGNDFINGKITLPFLHLLEVSGGKERKELEGYAKAPDERNWAMVRERIISSGAVDYCIDLSRDYVGKALKYLDFFQPSRYKDIILNLANFLLERNY